MERAGKGVEKAGKGMERARRPMGQARPFMRGAGRSTGEAGRSMQEVGRPLEAAERSMGRARQPNAAGRTQEKGPPPGSTGAPSFHYEFACSAAAVAFRWAAVTFRYRIAMLKRDAATTSPAWSARAVSLTILIAVYSVPFAA